MWVRRWDITSRTTQSRSENTLRTVVDIETIPSEKPDKADIKLLGDLNRETRGSTYGYDHGHTSHKSLLQEFEAGPSREKQQVSAKWGAICEERRTKKLIDGIMSANILANCLKIPIAIEKSRSVETSGLVEDSLSVTEPFGK